MLNMQTISEEIKVYSNFALDLARGTCMRHLTIKDASK